MYLRQATAAMLRRIRFPSQNLSAAFCETSPNASETETETPLLLRMFLSLSLDSLSQRSITLQLHSIAY